MDELAELASDVARDIYRRAELSPLLRPRRGAVELSSRLGLRIYRQPHALEEAAIASWDGGDKIVLRKGVEADRANFLVGQMLARLFLAGRGIVDPTLECLVAGWVVAPPGPFAAHYYQVGADLDALSRPFAITRTTAALRLNEVIGTSIVVLCKSRRPIRRGRGLLVSLPEEELSQLAKKRSTKRVRTVRLRDDGNAVALMAC